MTILAPVAIPPAGLPLPDPTDRTTFSARKLEWLRWSGAEFVTYSYNLGVASYSCALDAQGSATSAAINAAAVAANTALVQAAANAPLWVSGNNYNAQVLVCSPINQRIYRRINTGAGATDPSLDAVNWAFVSPLMRQVTEARAAVAISAGVLALDMSNGISGATLNANVTSLVLLNNAASVSAVHCHTLELTANGAAYTVAWPAGDGVTTPLFKWAGGVAPTLTTTNGKRDVFFFKSVSQFVFDAFIVGQNL